MGALSNYCGLSWLCIVIVVTTALHRRKLGMRSAVFSDLAPSPQVYFSCGPHFWLSDLRVG